MTKKSLPMALTIALGGLFSHSILADVSAKLFPENTFVTLKKADQVITFPSQKIWNGGPDTLYNALTPNGKLLVATSPSTGSLYVFDSHSGQQVAVIKTGGKAPKGVKITPNGRYAYVSNEASSTISVINLLSFKVIDTIKTAEAPHNVRFSNDGKIAYVTLQGGAGIGVIDTKKRKMINVIPVPGIIGPHNIDLSQDGKIAYVRDFVHNVAVLDLITGQVKKIIAVGNGHSGIDVIPSGQYIFAGGIGDHIVSVIDSKTNTVIKTIDVGAGPHGLRASKDSKWLYVTMTGTNEVVVIDIEKLTIADRIPVGNFPFWIAVQGNS
jgi:YVTN family beta-propeller protein